jgi:hypothetical protein
MQSMILAAVLLLSCCLNGCSSSSQKPKIKLDLVSTDHCELVFFSHGITLIENFCSSADKPIVIKSPNQQLLLDWIDEETSRFLFQEGCASPGACFYEISIHDSGVDGRFIYQVNLTEGEYSFEVDSSGHTNVLSRSSKDLPS